MPAVSLIISFYNRIDYLRLVLAGLEVQSFRNFEVIIADDGSDDSVVRQIESLHKEFNLIIKHCRHEKAGFRKNRILNLAIRAASADYLIFIDGDCVPHPEFVREHHENRNANACLTGRRVNLSEKFTQKLSVKKILNGYLQNGFLNLLADGVFGKSFDVEKGFYFRNTFLRKQFNKKKRGVLGCNFSLYKELMLKINGFDERYEAPSIGEDSDIQYRLELLGAEIISMNFIALQYHLYHRLQPRLQVNLDLFEAVKKEGKAFTDFGIKGKN